jgi:hypothetical protein
MLWCWLEPDDVTLLVNEMICLEQNGEYVARVAYRSCPVRLPFLKYIFIYIQFMIYEYGILGRDAV